MTNNKAHDSGGVAYVEHDYYTFDNCSTTSNNSYIFIGGTMENNTAVTVGLCLYCSLPNSFMFLHARMCR